jgi:aspartate kinase
VAIVRDEGRVSLSGVPHQPGAAHRIFAALAERHIVVDMVAQTVEADGRATIGFSVPRADLPATVETARRLAGDLGVTVDHDDAVSKVSVVGAGMRSRPGVAARMFRALADARIPVAMTTTGEIKISILVHHDEGLRALRTIHEAFRLEVPRPGAGLPAPGSVHPRGWPGPVADELRTAELTTRIQRFAGMEDVTVEDMELTSREGRIAVAGLPPAVDAAAILFEALARDGVVVSQIVFNRRSDGAGEMAFSVPQSDLERAAQIARNLRRTWHPSIAVHADGNTSVLVIRGVGVRSQAVAVGRFFGLLAERGVNIQAVNTSETALSVVVNREAAGTVAALAESAFGAPCRISA